VKNYKKLLHSLLKKGLYFTIKKIINIKMQEKFVKYYYNSKTLSKAIQLGERIVKIYPENFYNYQQLARAYWRNKDDDKAVNTLIRGIKGKYNIDLGELLYKIEQSIPNQSKLISNKFTFKGGHQNFGLIEHTYENRTLLTKIQPLILSNGEFIIKEVQEKNTSFNKITPSIINIFTINDLCFITMEKVYGEKPHTIDPNIIEKIYEINKITTCVNNFDFTKLLKEHNVKSKLEFINRHELFKAFYLINQYNKDIFWSFSQFLIKNNYPLKSVNKINYLNHIIVSKKYYKHLQYNNHFTLQHGDFFQSNMLMNYQTDELKVIDWGGMRIGPRWVDLAVFLAVSKQPFNLILNSFLEHQSCDYEPVEKLFFIYTLIVIWLVICNEEYTENYDKAFCSPALKYIEKLFVEIEMQKKQIPS
jgi:thiamine kinase-like enzyme